MRKTVVMFICILWIVSACERKPAKVILEKDSPAYQLAKELAVNLSILDPDSNKVIVTSKKFDITAGELVETINSDPRIPKESIKRMDGERLNRTMHRLVTEIAEKKLFLLGAKDARIKVADSEVDSVLQSQYARYGGEQQFEDMLQKSGMTMEFARKDIRNSIEMNKFMQKILDEEIQMSDEELEKAYTEYKSKEIATVRHVLLRTQGKSESEKKQIYNKIQEILKRAKDGEDIAELAKQFSEDPGSKDKGGLYEDFGRGRMVPAFDVAAFTIPVGELSDIIETPYGYHILKVISRNEYKPLNDMKSTLIDQYKKRQTQKVLKTYLEELKKKAELQIIDF